MRKRPRKIAFVLKDYTEAQRDELLRLIADGMTKTRACELLQIPKEIVGYWISADDDFNERYRRARTEQSHSLTDEILEIADAPASSMDAVHHAKLRVEARKWLIGKSTPRLYGEKVHQDHTHTVGVVLLPALDTEQQVLKTTLKQIAEANGE